MNKHFFVLFYILFLSSNIFSQETNYRKLFLSAESFFIFEEFDEALPQYMRIHRNDPENDNINYKIGICYLNDAYRKSESIAYLEDAISNINPKYKENSFKERGAPVDALFYLGNAYRINNQLEKAKENYRLFLQKVDPDVYDTVLINNQIASCDAAHKMMQKPIDITINNLSDRINTRFSDEKPIVSGDETKMAFISKLQFYDAVFFSEKIDGTWSAPRNIVPELGVDGDVYPTALNWDGTEMYIYRNDEFIGNLYSTKLINGKWTPLKKLNDNINTRFWESHASVTRDGKSLYFSSNRRGGYGGLDIYKSQRQENGDWGPAVNLGPVVNTPYNDDTPFITAEENKIFFSSYGHYNMGGYDIFMSVKNDKGIWAKPVNIGYPINTTDNDQFFLPLKNGQIAYYSLYKPDDGYGKHDIYRMEIYTPDNPRLYTVKGNVFTPDKIAKPEDIFISVTDRLSLDTLVNLHPDQNGQFTFQIPRGKYFLIFNGEKFRKKVLELDITKNTPHSGIVLEDNVYLDHADALNKPEAVADLLTIKEDSVLYAFDGEEINIRFNNEKGSVVIINHFNNAKLISSDTLNTTKKRLKHQFKPLPGENILEITVIDENGRSQTETIKVIVPDNTPPLIENENGEYYSDSMALSNLQEENSLSDIQKILEILRKNSEGDLLNYLNSLNPDSIGITSLQELSDHLYDTEPKRDFTERDIDEMLYKSGLMSDFEYFLKNLIHIATPSLEQYLRNFEPSNYGIDNKKDLISFLFDQAGNARYTEGDVTESLSRLYGPYDLDQIINNLNTHADTGMQSLLAGMAPDENELYTMDELVLYLINNKAQEFSDEDIFSMMDQYFTNSPGEFLIVLRNMKRLAKDKTSGYLNNINETEVWNISRKEFYDLVFNNASSSGIKDEDLLSLALASDKIDIHHFKHFMESINDEALKELIRQIPEDHPQPAAIYNFLISHSSVSEEESRQINEFCKEYLRYKDIYELYYDLLNKSDLNEVSTLDTVNFRNRFLSPASLAGYLNNLSKNPETGVSILSVPLSETYQYYQLLKVISDLTNLAEGSLKQALMDLDPKKDHILTLGDITNKLIAEKNSYGYTNQDVFDLIMKYLSSDSFVQDLPEPQEELAELKSRFRNGAKITAGVLLLSGLIILILILFAKRKKEKKK